MFLSRAVIDRSAMPRLRAVLASSSRARADVSRLDDQEVLQAIADLVVRGEVALAPASGGTLPPKKGKGKSYKHGDKIPAPVRFDKKKGTWGRVWTLATSPTPGELGSAPSDFSIEIKKDGPHLTPTTTGPEVSKELLTTLEDIQKDIAKAEKEQEDGAKALKENEEKLEAAKKEKKAAEDKLKAATTNDEKDDAKAELDNANEKIEMQKILIDANKKHIESQKKKVKDLQAKAERGIENVRLHEQTHLDINAKSVEHANELLKSETDHANRQKIIDAAADFAAATDEKMDQLLNPITFGSKEDDKKLADWISESSSENYHSTIKEMFDELKDDLK